MMYILKVMGGFVFIWILSQISLNICSWTYATRGKMLQYVMQLQTGVILNLTETTVRIMQMHVVVEASKVSKP